MNEGSAQLWADLHERVHAFVARRVASPADADDVVQDVFVRVHTHLADLRDDEALQGWIWRVARNAVTDHYRRRRETAPLADDVAADPPEPDDPADGLARCIGPFVDRLPEPYREAVRLTELEGLTQKRAAEQAQVSLSGMKSRVQRGRDRLRDLLLDCCAIELDRRGHPIDVVPRCCGGSGC